MTENSVVMAQQAILTFSRKCNFIWCKVGIKIHTQAALVVSLQNRWCQIWKVDLDNFRT